MTPSPALARPRRQENQAMSRRGRLLLLCVLLFLPLTSLQAREASLADLLAGDERFSTFYLLAGEAGLLDTLAAEGPMTLHAPINEAFAGLPDFATAWLLDHPAALGELLRYSLALSPALFCARGHRRAAAGRRIPELLSDRRQ
jgi:hypothetical protein